MQSSYFNLPPPNRSWRSVMCLDSLLSVAAAYLRLTAGNLKRIALRALLALGLVIAAIASPAMADTGITVVPSAGALPDGIKDLPYYQQITTSGGQSPYNFEILEGEIPLGITIDPTGSLMGVPSEAGTYEFTVRVSERVYDDSSPLSTDVTYTLKIKSSAIDVLPATLEDGTVGGNYSQWLSASGGVQPYTYQLIQGSLPDGMTLAGSHISGAPSASGTSTFKVKVTDSTSATAEIEYTLTVNPRTPMVTPVLEFLAEGDLGVPYSEMIGAVQGISPYTFTITQGSLPPGLTLSTINGDLASIAGTPSQGGTFEFTVNVTDSGGGTPGTASQTFKIVIQAGGPVITPSAETVELTKGEVHSKTINASGGRSPYAFETSGTLPPGLNFEYDGELAEITGTPTATGTYTFSVILTDANQNTTSAIYTYIIGSQSELTLAPSAGALPQGTLGTNYQQTIQASGGTGPYSYTITSGVIPNGLSFDQGILSGTPTEAGIFTFTVTALDSIYTVVSATYTITVTGSQSELVLTPSGGALPEAMVGEDYQQPITASGGTDPVLYSLASGQLPKGLVLNISTGELNGPLALDAADGDYTFTILATDANDRTITGSFTLKVGPRRITAPDKAVVVAPGTMPADVYLNQGATGGPFTLAEATFVEPAEAGTATIIRGQLAANLPMGQPTGWYMQFKPNPAFSGVARVGYRLTSALGISNNGTITYTLSYDPAQVANEIDGLVRGFVQTRQSLIASTSKVPGLMERRMAAAASDPVSVKATPSGEGLALGFASSLAQIDAARNAADGVIAAQPSRFNAWIEGAVFAHKRDDNAGRWGSFAMVSFGADYLLSERLLLGLSFHYDRMSDPTDADAKLTGNGWLAGPYASVALAENVFWDTSLRYGGSSNDIDTAFWDGEFDTTRWLIDSAVKGQWQFGQDMILTPKLRAVYFTEEVDDYTVENGAGDKLTIDGFDAEQFRLSLGAEISRSFTLEGGATLTPKFGATAGYSGLDGSGAFGSLTAGVSMRTGNDFTIDGGLMFDLSDGGDQAIGARATIAKRF